MPYYQALPLDLKPLHYNLAVYEIGHDLYKGTVAIDLQVVNATDELHLHYRELSIADASAKDDEGAVGVELSEFHEKKEYFVLKFERALTKNATVTLHFSGRIQTNMAGFYRSLYTENGEDKHMLSTQFEATDARRAFPCMDEPDRKATFSVLLTVPEHRTVLGNMPILKEEKKDGMKTVEFQKSPVMSTYLLAWAIGDFEYIEGFTADKYVGGKPLPVRIYTTRGYTLDAKLALEVAPKIVDYFSQIFQVQYPLPKLDLLAVHAFLHNAMENWGLITYRSTALLYSEGKSDPSYKQKVAYVVAHEIAHQWFGNLVTMQWWDELWLNEGFATWVGFLAVDHLFPEWDIFSTFVSESLQEALRLDGLRNSHPIKVPVVDALDIDQLFDAISYLKGALTILMLSSYLKTETFLDGVAHYLRENQYGNAQSRDLWALLLAVSGQNVGRMMDAWISKIGFPVVHVQEDSGVVLHQQRFLNGGDVSPEEDETVWWIPLNILSDGPSPPFLDDKESRLETPTGLFKLNKDTQAPFRVHYEEQFFKKHVLDHFEKLSTKDKVGIIADVASLATAGLSSTQSFLEMVNFTVENGYLGEEYVLWLELSARMGQVATVFSTPEIRAFCRKIYTRIAVKLLTEEVPRGDFQRAKLKAHMLYVASAYGIPELDSFARSEFARFKNGENVDPALRKFIFSAVVSDVSCTQDDFELILAQVTHPTSLDSREVALGALGNIANEHLAKKLMEFLVDESVIPTMDAHFLAVGLSKNTRVRDLFWAFVKENYEKIHRLMSTNMVVLDRFLKTSLCNYQSFSVEEDVRTFFKDKDIHGFERALYQVLDLIKIRAAWQERDNAAVQLWLSKKTEKN